MRLDRAVACGINHALWAQRRVDLWRLGLLDRLDAQLLVPDHWQGYVPE